MRQQLKKILQSVITPLISALKRFDSTSQHSDSTLYKEDLMGVFYKNLIQMGFVPKHIVDVGANHGTWARETIKYFPDANYTLIEPQYWMAESIKDLTDKNPKVKFHPYGAGAVKGEFQFTIVDRDDSCSFRYTADEALMNGYKQLTLPVITLNEFLPATSLPIPDIIKIDAEGQDLGVLEGASRYFGKTEIFMVEAGIVNKSFDNSLLKVINYMDSHGYVLFDITDINRPFVPAVMWLAELVFVRKNGVINSHKII